jgi:hypothetical protein
MHHKSGRTQLVNIHDPANLVALCRICHTAFNDKEWAVLPKDMAAWVQDAEAEPEIDFIQEINSRRNIEYRRWRLLDDSESEASKDVHYVSAFTNEPIKIWPGEVGAIILGHGAIVSTPAVEADIMEAIESFMKLNSIWMKYNNPCAEQKCPLCSPKGDNESDKDTDQGSGHYEGVEDDDNEGEDDGWCYEGSEDDNEGEKGRRKRSMPPRRRRGPLKISPKSHKYQPRYSSNRSKVSMAQNITRKKSKSKYYSTIPYDKSVPYSHRVGDTYANTTSNELMAIWQGLPYIKHPNGRITITGPSYRSK